MNWVIIFFLLLVFWSIAAFVLAGPCLRRYDKPVGEYFDTHPEDLTANKAFLKSIQSVRKNALKSKSLKQSLYLIREFADNLSADLESDSNFIKAKTDTAEGQTIDAEWVLAPNVDTNRRVLFIHGGAFCIGSAVGHRKFSDRLSHLCNAAVLSVNYRLLPEHSRKSGILDTQKAYQWVVENGPNGPRACDYLLVAGDSAGGNLAFMLSSWSKLNHYRQPDAVIGFSPTLDSSMGSPTFKSNRKSDKMLGPSVGTMSLLPRALFLWVAFLALRIKPCNPVISPLFYNLTDLPPTLIHVSSSEMLLGDSIRYTNKAIENGSDVTLQIWQDQLHDWQMFNMGAGSAEEAWSEVKKFIDRVELS